MPNKKNMPKNVSASGPNLKSREITLWWRSPTVQKALQIRSCLKRSQCRWCVLLDVPNMWPSVGATFTVCSNYPGYKLCLKFALHTQSPYLRFNNPFRVRNTPKVLKYPFLCNKQQHHSPCNLIGPHRSRCFLLLGESLGNDDASSSGSIILASSQCAPWFPNLPLVAGFGSAIVWFVYWNETSPIRLLWRIRGNKKQWPINWTTKQTSLLKPGIN